MDFEVVIVDDHSLVLEGLKSLLKATPGIKEIHTARNAADLLELMPKYKFHICIIDLDLPDMDGFELIRLVRKQQPEIRIIVSTMHEEIWIVNRLKTQSIDGVVFKSSASKHIQEAIQAVSQGNSYYCPRFRQLYKEKERVSSISETPDSTPTIRELEILKDIAKGMNTHEISAHLFISENTVEWHRKNLMVKFGARNATDLVIKALAKGFLSIPLT